MKRLFTKTDVDGDLIAVYLEKDGLRVNIISGKYDGMDLITDGTLAHLEQEDMYGNRVPNGIIDDFSNARKEWVVVTEEEEDIIWDAIKSQ